MNLRHLQHLAAVCDCGFSISEAAQRLNVAQSVVSRNIQSLEESFGGELFVRKGRRLLGMTPLCAALIGPLREISVRMDCLKAIAEESLSQPVSGVIRIACTHLQARYVLPGVLAKVRDRHPDVRVVIHQAFPGTINELLMSNAVDLGICSEVLADSRHMVAAEAFSWERVLIVPRGHALAGAKRITLKRLASEPVITYIRGITGRKQFDEAFAAAGLSPNVVVAAADSDVVKEFTRKGHGIGVISEIAYEKRVDEDLVARGLPGLFRPMQTRVAHRRDRVLTAAQELFMDIFLSESARHASCCHRDVA